MQLHPTKNGYNKHLKQLRHIGEGKSKALFPQFYGKASNSDVDYQ
nr:hypothetical protein [Hassalia byssoidea]